MPELNVFAPKPTRSHNQQGDTADGIEFLNYRDINSENSNTDTDDDDDDDNNRCWTPPSSPQNIESLLEMKDLVLRAEAFFQITPNPDNEKKYNLPRHCNENFEDVEDSDTDDEYGRINSSSQTLPTSPQGPRPAQGPLTQPMQFSTFKQPARTSLWQPSIQQGGKPQRNGMYKDTLKLSEDIHELICKLKTFTIPRETTTSQITAVEHVLRANRWDWDAIVGVPGIKGLNYTTDEAYDKAVDTAFILLYMLTDPRFNEYKDAESAHDKVINAGKKIGVSTATITALENWKPGSIPDYISVGKSKAEMENISEVAMKLELPQQKPQVGVLRSKTNYVKI